MVLPNSVTTGGSVTCSKEPQLWKALDLITVTVSGKCTSVREENPRKAPAKTVVTVEDGSIYGGLGGAVAEVLVDAGIAPAHFKRLGLTTFGTAGTLPQLLNFFGLDAKGIRQTIVETL